MNLNEDNHYKTLIYRRAKMVESQIECRGIGESNLLDAMRKVPRHLFVPHEVKDRAYDDCPLPIGHSQTISQPYIVALMTQALDLTGEEKVLELGTGSGYQAAILCEMAGMVISIERHEELACSAGAILSSLGYDNFKVVVGDGTLGLADEAPFDRVLITAATPQVPEPVVGQLREGGIVVAPVGARYEQELIKAVKRGMRLEKSFLGGCRFVKLVGKYGFKK